MMGTQFYLVASITMLISIRIVQKSLAAPNPDPLYKININGDVAKHSAHEARNIIRNKRSNRQNECSGNMKLIKKTIPGDCQHRETKGSDYTGTANRTKYGTICQKWTSQEPHSHKFEDMGDHNYCRNPDDADSVWCFTTDPDQRWQYCDVPFCGGTGRYTARSSSVLPKENDDNSTEPDIESFGPLLAIDEKISETCHLFFHSMLEDYPWLEIELSPPTTIYGIQIFNRRDCCGGRLHDIEVRAGNMSVPEGFNNKLLEFNSICGVYEGPGEAGFDPKIKCDSPITDAQFITVQIKDVQSYLQVNEVMEVIQ